MTKEADTPKDIVSRKTTPELTANDTQTTPSKTNDKKASAKNSAVASACVPIEADQKKTAAETDNPKKRGNKPTRVPQTDPPLFSQTPGAVPIRGLGDSPPQPLTDDYDDASPPLQNRRVTDEAALEELPHIAQAHLVPDDLEQQLQEQARELEELRRSKQETIEAVQVVVEDDDKKRSTTCTTRESSKRWLIVVGFLLLTVVAVVLPWLLKRDNNDTVSLYWLQLGTDIVGDTAFAYSGKSADLSADGNIVAIGAGGFDRNLGQLKVFEFKNKQWEQLGRTIVGEEPEDWLGLVGVVLSADGRIMAAGGPYRNDSRGHVRVFAYNDDWIQLGNTLHGTQVGQLFGYAVSMSADGYRLAIGSPTHDKDAEGGLRLTGLAQVFRYDEQTDLWMQVGQDLSGSVADGELGLSVALSSNGTIVAAGAPYAMGLTGLVRVWELHVGDDLLETWKQLGHDIVGLEPVGASGAAIALSPDGHTLAVGAPLGNGDGKEEAGVVQVLRYNPKENEWVQRGQNIAGEERGDNAGQFSLSFSADGNTLVVGSHRNGHKATGAGQARVFEFVEANNRWEQVGEAIYGENEDDEHGTSVALSGDGKTLCVGTDYYNGNGEDSGYVQVYRAAN